MICQSSYFICYFELKKTHTHRKWSTALSKKISEDSFGDRVIIQKKNNGKMSWETIFFFHGPSQVLFKAGVIHLGFLFIFMSTMNPCMMALNIHWWASLFLPCSIAMATKENMTSQRGMLKSIQSKMNTLASILYDSLKSVFLGGKSPCASPLSPSLGQIAIVSDSRSHL